MLNARTATGIGLALVILFSGIYLLSKNDSTPSTESSDELVSGQITSEQSLPTDPAIDPSIVNEDLKPDPGTSSQLIGQIDESINIAITRASLSGSTLSVSGLVSGLDGGTCTASAFTEDDGPTASAETISSNGNVGCTVELDVSAMPSDQDWIVEMSVSNDELISPAQTKTVAVGER